MPGYTHRFVRRQGETTGGAINLGGFNQSVGSDADYGDFNETTGNDIVNMAVIGWSPTSHGITHAQAAATYALV